MKKIILVNIFFLLLASSSLFSQEDFRKMAPKSGPAPRIELGKAEQFTLKNGLKVIVVENHKLPKVSVQMYVDVPPSLQGEMVGFHDMAGQMLSRGTNTRSKAAIDQAIDFLGASISSSSEGISGSSLTKHKDKMLEIMADMLLHPSFPADEFEKLKKQSLSSLAQSKDDPNTIAANVSSVLRNGNQHPYGEVENEESINKVTVEKAREFYQLYFKPNISYLIFTGDITAKDARAAAQKYFGDWKMGDVKKENFAAPQVPATTQVAFVDKAGAVQSVINVTYPVDFRPGSGDAIQAAVMNTLLGGYFSSRLNANLREGKGYTYGARSLLDDDPMVGYFNAYASVRNEVTDSAVVEFLAELNRLRTEPIEQSELDMVKNVMTGNFARSLENPETVARFTLNIARYNLPADYYATYLEKLSKVTAGEINTMANKYLTPANAHILVVGNKDDVAGKLTVFSPENKINFYTVYGQPIEAGSTTVPSGVTAESVIAAYIKALGGQKLEDIKSIQINMTANLQGMSMVTELNQMAPNKLSMVNSVMGNIVMSSTFDGVKGSNMQMGQKSLMEGATLEDMKVDSRLFPERFYKELGVKTELKGLEMIEDKKAYKMVVEYPSGTRKTQYFDMESGLKIREVEEKEGNVVTTDQKNYKEVNGIKFPHTISITGAAPFPITMESNSIELNSEIDSKLFDVK